jgi:hypothetical protein
MMAAVTCCRDEPRALDLVRQMLAAAMGLFRHARSPAVCSTSDEAGNRQRQPRFVAVRATWARVDDADVCLDLADAAQRWVRREQIRSGGTKGEAINAIARRHRLAPGTFANIARQRVKDVAGRVRDRFIAALMDDLSREIEWLSHEREHLRHLAGGPDQDDVAALDDCLQTAREALMRIARRRDHQADGHRNSRDPARRTG